MGHWIFKGHLRPEEWQGFCYQIHNLDKDKRYLGRRYFCPAKGLKKGILNPKWHDYRGSNKSLLQDISQGDKCKYEILGLYKTVSGLVHGEIWGIMALQALVDSRFYNVCCDRIRVAVGEPLQKEHIKMIEKIKEELDG